MLHEIEIITGDGMTYARFLEILPESPEAPDLARVYYGGVTGAAAQDPAAANRYGLYGTHFYVQLAGLLDIAGRLAQADESFTVQGRRHGSAFYAVLLRQDMKASELASALGCAEQSVVDHFRLLVRLFETESETVSGG